MARKKVKGMPRKQQNFVMRKMRTTSAGVTNRMKPRKTQAIDDSIKRKHSEIKDERANRTEYNKRLAVERDHIKKKQIKRKIRGTNKKIKRKKREITQTKRKKHEAKYVMNKLHTSDYSEAETLLDYANDRDVEYNEVEWEEIRGADLSTEKKKEMLKRQLEKDYSSK